MEMTLQANLRRAEQPVDLDKFRKRKRLIDAVAGAYYFYEKAFPNDLRLRVALENLRDDIYQRHDEETCRQQLEESRRLIKAIVKTLDQLLQPSALYHDLAAFSAAMAVKEALEPTPCMIKIIMDMNCARHYNSMGRCV